MSCIAIVDTNIVVSGLLTGNDTSPVVRILDDMLSGALTFALSEVLLAEYRNVLLRPKLMRLHGLSPDDIDVLLTDLAHLAVFLHPEHGSPAPDPGDQHLWDLLAERSDLVLVTGDVRLLEDSVMQGRVLPASVFLAR